MVPQFNGYANIAIKWKQNKTKRPKKKTKQTKNPNQTKPKNGYPLYIRFWMACPCFWPRLGNGRVIVPLGSRWGLAGGWPYPLLCYEVICPSCYERLHAFAAIVAWNPLKSELWQVCHSDKEGKPRGAGMLLSGRAQVQGPMVDSHTEKERKAKTRNLSMVFRTTIRV